LKNLLSREVKSLLCLGLNEEPTKSLWLRIKDRAGTGDVIVGICYRPLDQEDRADEALSRQTGTASCSQPLVLVGTSTTLISVGVTAGHK